MIKRILPFYLSGWFYLTLVFWCALICFVSLGGLNAANQLNIKVLEKVTPEHITSPASSTLTQDNVLTLHASLNEDNLSAIKTLLSQQKTSQIVLLGKPTQTFINQLDSYLSSKPRKNKIIINSSYEFSESPLRISDSMILSNALNWFRFDENNAPTQVSSKHFVFSPFLLNERHSFPMLWRYQGETYASLLTELLQQLNGQRILTLNQQAQLILNNPEGVHGPENLYLGFNSNLFVIGDAYQVAQYNQQNRTPNYLINNELKSLAFKSNNLSRKVEDTEANATLKRREITPVTHFIQQSDHASTNQYKVIILTSQLWQENEVVKPLLISLSQESYLSQGLLTILLTGTLLLIGIAIIWFIQKFNFKQQLFAVFAYLLLQVIAQTLLFNQKQWLEILPNCLLIIGTWSMFYAYQKEDFLFSTTLTRQAEKLKSGSSPAAVIAKHIATNQRRPDYNSPQNFSPNATITTNSTDDLEKTMLMNSPAMQNKKATSHHITVENFGRYQVEGILGKGAMGIVYQGVDPKINRHVAIKTLQLSSDIDSTETQEAKDRFFREAQTAGGLSHANIVTIYDVGEENNLGYIAMDLLTGAPLSLFTQPGQTLPTPLVYQLLIQITDALEYAHKQKVVHRDIKPANIIFDDDLIKVTVTDFGIAYVSDHSKTRTGVIMGSPYYMSPEQILGLKVDGRSDIFSLGVTFYQLLCGHLPFEGESIATVAYQITKAKPTAVNDHNSELPASALRITNKAMHKDIEKRYQTMAEFKLALVNALKRDYKITVN